MARVLVGYVHIKPCLASNRFILPFHSVIDSNTLVLVTVLVN